MTKKRDIEPSLLEELTRSKIRVNEANAEKNELKNAVTRGELVSIEDVRMKWSEDVSNVKSKLLALPTKITPMLAGKTYNAQNVRRILTDAIYEALNELAGEY